ncbi:hypothetical protein DPQ33_16845 [Oceanidesulfovibrio indonesiensis]|uniref:PilZ domain-containing protein n=1 Tax=Oceanidesulfovibrio indonesiensis TaxID=54767 RepID=A0A7M3MB36_9BACT|nr:PilZ domain-containing protein [Oceanidesulfovibrio indonesiensis]TVM14676.1 hypothetical protein DPQ33_16845 [Oceanidesulfovibrio indonesiensis]
MPKLAGSFYTIASADLGEGSTRQEALRRVNWFAVYLDDDRVLVCATDGKGMPTSVSRKVSLQEFFGKFIPDSEHYEAVLHPLLLGLREKLDACGGDTSRLNTEERSLYKALQLDSSHVPGASEERLRNLPQELLCELPDYEAQASEHKHRLNTASIQSRKSGRYQEALELYNAMLRTTPDDYHVVFNVARVYFEKQDYLTCAKCLQLALEYAPDFVEARKFLLYLERHFLGDASEERFILRYKFFSPQPCTLKLGDRKYPAAVLDISSSGLQMKTFDNTGALLKPGAEFVVRGEGGLLKPLLPDAGAEVVWRKNDICGAFFKSMLDSKSREFKRIIGYARIV